MTEAFQFGKEKVEFINLAEESIEDIAAWVENPHIIAYVDGIRRVITTLLHANYGQAGVKTHAAVPLTGCLLKQRLEPHPRLLETGVTVRLVAAPYDPMWRDFPNAEPVYVSLKKKDA